MSVCAKKLASCNKIIVILKTELIWKCLVELCHSVFVDLDTTKFVSCSNRSGLWSGVDRWPSDFHNSL